MTCVAAAIGAHLDPYSEAGGACELHVHPGCYHSSDMFNPGVPSTRRMSDERIGALKRAFAGEA